MPYALITFVLLAFPTVAFAKDCLVIPNVSICGVPLTASQATFEKTFGEPDGRVKLGDDDQTGLIYGSNFIVIFWHGKISDIQNWASWNGPDSMYWFNYIAYGRADRKTWVMFPNWNPWDLGASSEKVKAALSEMPEIGVGDENSEIRKIPGGSTFILYGEQETGGIKERSDRILYLKVNFNGEPATP